MFEKYPDIVTVEQAMKMLSIGKSKLYELIRNKSIIHMTVGKKYLIPKIHLVDFVNKSCYDNSVVANSPS